MGALPEDLGLFDALTIEEHLELCGPIYGLSRTETRERTGALLRILGLENGRCTYLDQCSHGMRKKTALAMALLHNPRVLLLDEPFEGIDPVSSVTIRDLLIAVAGRVLRALRRAVGRDLGTLQSVKINNLFLFVALLVYGALASGQPPKSAEPLVVLQGFLVAVSTYVRFCIKK